MITKIAATLFYYIKNSNNKNNPKYMYYPICAIVCTCGRLPVVIVSVVAYPERRER